MRKYRLVCVLKQSMSAEEAQQNVDTVTEYIKNKNGKLLDSKNLGLERLSYPINRDSRGHYFVLDVEMNQEDIAGLRYLIAVNENFLREMVIALNKYDQTLDKMLESAKERKQDLSCASSCLYDLSRFVASNGKMLPRHLTGLDAKKMRLLSVAIKRARYLALLPFKARPNFN